MSAKGNRKRKRTRKTRDNERAALIEKMKEGAGLNENIRNFVLRGIKENTIRTSELRADAKPLHPKTLATQSTIRDIRYFALSASECSKRIV